MFDIAIRNGTIVDGSGGPARIADVAITNGRIVEVSASIGRARRNIDADGCIVTPGFVDMHTHYDGQATWDDKLAPSFNHGVTTVVTGNCGVGFAPVHRDEGARACLIELMEGVEDIPGIALAEGLPWNWESFPEYLDALGARSFSMDIATQIGHGPVRTYVMGERSLNHEPATAQDIATMARIAAAGVEAGAMGFSSSRILGHQSVNGSPVPGTFAADDELIGIGRAVAAAGGTFQVVPGGSTGAAGIDLGDNEPVLAEEINWMTRLSTETGMPITFCLMQFMEDPEAFREGLRLSDAANARGANLYPQTAGRSLGILTGWQSNHLFQRRPAYLRIASLPLDQRIVELRKGNVRSAILSESDAPPESPALMDNLHLLFAMSIEQLYPLGSPPNYEPHPALALANQAKNRGVATEEFIYDMMCEDHGRAMLLAPKLNYVHGNFDALYEMLTHPGSLLGLGDGGAHCGLICDASAATSMLSHWARDRTRGPRIPLEIAVRKMTAETAAFHRLSDRGLIAAGRRADINVIDFDSLSLSTPYVVNDLPAGGLRLMQDATGYVGTLVNGIVTRQHDEDTGERPGRLIRSTDYR